MSWSASVALITSLADLSVDAQSEALLFQLGELGKGILSCLVLDVNISQNRIISRWQIQNTNTQVQWGIIINVVTVSFHTNPLTRIGAYSVLVARWQVILFIK